MEIIQIYLEKREYSMASRLLDLFCNQSPIHSNALYLNSFMKKKNKEFEKAIYFGEKFRLREPSNIKNLINLADCYRFMNKIGNANKFLNRALKLEPNNKQALKLQENLKA